MTVGPAADATAEQTTAIGEVAWRRIVRVEGRVRDVRVRPWQGGGFALECAVFDDTGGVTLVFLGRTQIGGITLGRRLQAVGMVSENRERLVILNPTYTLLQAS